MSVERRGHPANWLYYEISTLYQDITFEGWWTKLNSIFEEVSNFEVDPRSYATVCFFIAKELKHRLPLHPEKKIQIDQMMHDQLIPIWERELDKSDNLTNIPSKTWEFAITIGGEISQNRINKSARKFSQMLPPYSQIPFIFPDDDLQNGYEAIQAGKLDWHNQKLSLYKFCGLGYDINKILLLCASNSWSEEADLWNPIQNYFQNLLLNIDYTRIDPRLTDEMFQYIQTFQTNINPQTVETIEKRYYAWKCALRHVYGSTVNSNEIIM